MTWFQTLLASQGRLKVTAVTSTQLGDVLHKKITATAVVPTLFVAANIEKRAKRHLIDCSCLSSITRAGSETVWHTGTSWDGYKPYRQVFFSE